jgi:hypothetical protein
MNGSESSSTSQIMRKHISADTIENTIPASGRYFPRPVSRYAPHASPKMLVTVTVSVVKRTRISISPKLPKRMTPIPITALRPIDAMSRYRKRRRRFM